MSSRKRKISMDSTSLRDDAVMQVVQFVGEGSYRSVAGTCRRSTEESSTFAMSSVDGTLQTVSGGALLPRHRQESRFRMAKEDGLCADSIWNFASKNTIGWKFNRDTSALDVRHGDFEWAVAKECSLDNTSLSAVSTIAAFRGHLPLLQKVIRVCQHYCSFSWTHAGAAERRCPGD